MTRVAEPAATDWPMNRGEFLQNSLLLMIVGAGCLLSKGKSAYAADAVRDVVRGPGSKGPTNPTKPALTEESLNQFIESVRKGLPPDSEALKTRATRDWRALLQDQFAVTPTQKRALRALPKETVQQVQEAVRQAIHTNSALVVRAIASPGGGTPATASIDKARIAEFKKPGSIECTKSDGTYQCVVKAGIVC